MSFLEHMVHWLTMDGYAGCPSCPDPVEEQIVVLHRNGVSYRERWESDSAGCVWHRVEWEDGRDDTGGPE